METNSASSDACSVGTGSDGSSVSPTGVGWVQPTVKRMRIAIASKEEEKIFIGRRLFHRLLLESRRRLHLPIRFLVSNFENLLAANLIFPQMKVSAGRQTAQAKTDGMGTIAHIFLNRGGQQNDQRNPDPVEKSSFKRDTPFHQNVHGQPEANHYVDKPGSSHQSNAIRI